MNTISNNVRRKKHIAQGCVRNHCLNLSGSSIANTAIGVSAPQEDASIISYTMRSTTNVNSAYEDTWEDRFANGWFAADWPINYYGDWPINMWFMFTGHNDGNVRLRASWSSYNQFGELGSPCGVWIHLCSVDPNSVSDSDRWTSQRDNLFAPWANTTKLGIVDSTEVISSDGDWLRECDLFEMVFRTSPSYYICYEIHFPAASTGIGDKVWMVWSNNPVGLVMTSTPAPSLSYNKESNAITIGTSRQGKRVVEFYDTEDAGSEESSGVDEETLNNFLLSSMIRPELYYNDNVGYAGYYNSGNHVLYRWPPGTYTVSFDVLDFDRYAVVVYNYAKTVISDINNLLRDYGVQFKLLDYATCDGDIEMRYGTSESLWGESYEDSGLGGHWEVEWDGEGHILHARVDISYATHYFTTFAHTTFEEFYQCLGCGHDQYEYAYNTTTYEAGEYLYKPISLSQKDGNMLRLLYSNAVRPGNTLTEVSLAHNIPIGCKVIETSEKDVSQTVSLNFLKPGHTYRVRAWIVDRDGDFSVKSQAITVAMPALIVSPWDWGSSNGAADAAQTRLFEQILLGNKPASAGFSHKVWNDLVDKVGAMRDAYGLAWTTENGTYFTKAQCYVDAKDTLSAKLYNSVRYQVGSIPNHGTGIPDRVKGGEILGYHIYHMVEVLNDIIAEL